MNFAYFSVVIACSASLAKAIDLPGRQVVIEFKEAKCESEHAVFTLEPSGLVNKNPITATMVGRNGNNARAFFDESRFIKLKDPQSDITTHRISVAGDLIGKLRTDRIFVVVSYDPRARDKKLKTIKATGVLQLSANTQFGGEVYATKKLECTVTL